MSIFLSSPQISALSLAPCVAGLFSVSVSQAQTFARAESDRNLVVQRVGSGSAVQSNQRLALVIGNAAYKEAPLLNPVNDARAIAKALQESGFTVILRENADQRAMASALREFGDRLRTGGTGLFYYAGHGMQIKGRNFLIPVGANVDREDEVAYSAVDAQAVLDKMEAAGNGANIMILDACRNNPFTRSMRSGQAGLAQMDAPVGTLVAFATSPGAVASDGAGQNGLYTQHLLEAMRKEGSKVEDVFKQVRANVRRDSQGKQVPWEATSMEGDFYFRGGKANASVNPHIEIEQALWDAVKNSNQPIELRAYLNRYPQGRFAQQAQNKITSLLAAKVTAAAPNVSQARPPSQAPTAAGNAPAPQKERQEEFQEAIDRRTQELLAELAAQRPVQNSPTLSSQPAASNLHGFTVGDRWRYQVVDKFKAEVVSNYVLQIDAIFPGGDLRINSGASLWNAKGEVKFSRNAERERRFANFISLPDKLENGFKQTSEYEIDNQFIGSPRRFKETSQQTMIVRGQETIKTPAGEFLAWKIDRDVWWKTTEGGAGSFKATGWYVPALRRYVAWDEESRNSNGSFNRRERHELTSYNVRGADEALARR